MVALYGLPWDGTYVTPRYVADNNDDFRFAPDTDALPPPCRRVTPGHNKSCQPKQALLQRCGSTLLLTRTVSPIVSMVR